MVLRGGGDTRHFGYNGRASGALHCHRGWHKRSPTVATIRKLEVLDAHGVGALDDRSSERHWDILRMVCGTIPVMLDRRPTIGMAKFGLGLSNLLRAYWIGCDAGYYSVCTYADTCSAS